MKIKSTGQATSALCKDTTRRSGIVTPSGDFYAGHERIMTKDNKHGLQHMVPCGGPDGGTSIIFALDFVEATPTDGLLWAKHVKCVEEASETDQDKNKGPNELQVVWKLVVQA